MIGKRIRKLRENKGLTQLEFAKSINISNSTLSQYESEHRAPSDEIKIKIADFFNVSLDYLLGQTDDPRPIDQVNKENQERVTKALSDEDPEVIEFWNELK